MKKILIVFFLILVFMLSFILTNKYLLNKNNLNNIDNQDNTGDENNTDSNNIDDEHNTDLNNPGDENDTDLNIDKDYTIKYRDKAETLLSSLTLEEKVGQLFLGRLYEDTALDDINNYNLSGFILFDANVNNKDKESLKTLLSSYQDESKIPLFIAIDEEGGTVNRISNYYAFRESPFLSPKELYNLGGYEQIKSDTLEKIELLKSIGINLNLAPVADISTSSNDYMYERSFSDNEEDVSKYISIVTKLMNENSMGSSLKHFPGYGGNLDTHIGLSIDNRSLEELKSKDLIPFKVGIEHGASSILVSHNIISEVDSQYPASLSPEINKIIRDYLGFDGVVITDDLIMDAINLYIGSENSAVLAINAGNDLLIASDYKVQIPIIIDAINRGEISLERIDEAVLRVLTLKYSLNLIK